VTQSDEPFWVRETLGVQVTRTRRTGSPVCCDRSPIRTGAGQRATASLTLHPAGRFRVVAGGPSSCSPVPDPPCRAPHPQRAGRPGPPPNPAEPSPRSRRRVGGRPGSGRAPVWPGLASARSARVAGWPTRRRVDWSSGDSGDGRRRPRTVPRGAVRHLDHEHDMTVVAACGGGQEDGHEVVESLAQACPGVVVTDLVMPAFTAAVPPHPSAATTPPARPGPHRHAPAAGPGHVSANPHAGADDTDGCLGNSCVRRPGVPADLADRRARAGPAAPRRRVPAPVQHCRLLAPDGLV
jgi:hypothetical protein